jgi:hypothetical protein
MSLLSEEDRTNLVAFLDGELDEQAAQVLEAKLSRDPQMRAEAEALKKTWELLDYLPRPEPSLSFTHRTLERLAVRESQRAAAASGWSWLAPVGWVAAMLIALAGGLFAAHQLWPPNQPAAQGVQPSGATPLDTDIENAMANDAGMLRSLPYYQHVEDVGQLRQLDHKDYFGDDEPGS